MIAVYLTLNLLAPPALAAGAALAARRSPRLGLAVAGTCLVLLVVRPFLIHQPCLEHYLFPWSGYLLVHGWHFFLFPPLVLALRARLTRVRARRALLFLAVLLYALHAVQVGRVVRGQSVQLDERATADGFRLQSAPYACAAASGANLLRLHGVAATETEMARRSLLAEGRGVHDLGVLRALGLTCAGTHWRPLLRRMTLGALIADGRPALAPLSHGLLVNHMVCVLGAHPQRVEILDPAEGRITVPVREFEARYLGRVIQLVPRASR